MVKIRHTNFFSHNSACHNSACHNSACHNSAFHNSAFHNSAFTIPLVVGCFCVAQFRLWSGVFATHNSACGRVFLRSTIPLVVGCFCYAKNINHSSLKKELYNLLLREKKIVETIIYFIYKNH